jgi:hypothetical protein
MVGCAAYADVRPVGRFQLVSASVEHFEQKCGTSLGAKELNTCSALQAYVGTCNSLMKIFLSAVSGQFKACRDALRSDLSAVGAEVVVHWIPLSFLLLTIAATKERHACRHCYERDLA